MMQWISNPLWKIETQACLHPLLALVPPPVVGYLTELYPMY